jgi:aryl-alcohol dehydrogenase-like predicted oxidoreductase
LKYRELGKTGWKISTISFGSWAIGGSWGNIDDKDSLESLHKALDLGVNFFDTADVYGDGRSEQLLAKLKTERKENFYIATKAGRQLNPHISEGYNKENITSFVERSLKNLNTDSIDLLQLHCPPTEVYYRPEVFGVLDDLVKDGKLKFYGVSVEKVEEALKAIEYPNVQSVQIIFNILRQRPKDLFFSEAAKKKVGILARVPLSSGMLTGKLTKNYKFDNDDHRYFNRNGESFDKGETFSGIDYERSLEVVEKLKKLLPKGMALSQLALRWIMMFDEVTCTIPGAKRTRQVEENVTAADLPDLPPEVMDEINKIYNNDVKELVHHYW